MAHPTSISYRRTLILALLIGASLSCMTARAQEPENFEGFMTGIRANAVKGEVVYQRKDGKFDLEPGLKLEEGDSIKSGADGYAELLLQPGNYLRVGGDTQFQIISEQYDRMRFKLSQGTIGIELLTRETGFSFYSPRETHDLIRLIMPDATLFINYPGIYRINISRGRTEVVVRKGEASIDGRLVKEKRRAVATGGTVMLSEIDSKVEDRFDAWCRERASAMVEANKLLKKQTPWTEREKEGEEASLELPEERPSGSAYVVSAKPGTVNFAETGVELGREKEWQPLTEKWELQAGDGLRTNVNSFAEVMLFPDMYLRLAGSTEVVFEQLSNDAITMKLVKGSAILDVARFDRKQGLQITLAGPSTSVLIDGKGNYRIDLDAVTIREGRVISNERAVGDGHRIAGGTVSESDKKRTDSFDFWSQHRGEGELYNARGTVARASLLAKLRRFRLRSTGFWFQLPGQTSYTFVPFYSQMFRSPYGGNYSTVLSPRRTPMNRINVGRPSSRFPQPQIGRPQP